MSPSSPFWSATPLQTPSPFTIYSAKDWSHLAGNETSSLRESDLKRLRSAGDAISLSEIDHIYLAISRLLKAHTETSRALFKKRGKILPTVRQRTPFIIAIAGSVAVGKSTTARLVQELIKRWPKRPTVDLITTDGFLYPNAELQSRTLMHRKGFPESYDRTTMLRFLSNVKSGQQNVQAPVYSHIRYDIDPTQTKTINQPDVLIFEGLNVLQPPFRNVGGEIQPLASDFFDFSIYVDAATSDIKRWYITRFLTLRQTAFSNPKSHFAHYASLSDDQAITRATELWESINAVNLRENIRPTRPRADLILRKGPDHSIEQIALRRL